MLPGNLTDLLIAFPMLKVYGNDHQVGKNLSQISGAFLQESRFCKEVLHAIIRYCQRTRPDGGRKRN